MAEQPELRISDAERQGVIDLLRGHTADGRLSLDEFSDRVETVLAARVRSELLPALAELPEANLPVPVPLPEPAVGAAPAKEKRRRIVAIMSGNDRKGRWKMSKRTTAFAFWGAIEIDLRQATIEGSEVDIRCWAIMGGIKVFVPEGFPVESDGFILMGDRKERLSDAPLLPGAPTIRIQSYGLWGGVSVQSMKMGEKTLKEHVREHVHQQLHKSLPGTVPEPSPPAATGTLTVLITDIVSSTAMAEQLGDQRWLEVLQAHNALVREQLSRYGGIEVKQTGDGFLATFGSARSAVRAALAIRQAIEDYRQGHPDTPIQLRIGIHAGEVEHEGADVFGVNVSTATRICALATPGEVLVSGVVRDLAESTSDLRFGEANEITIAGRSAPVRVHPAY